MSDVEDWGLALLAGVALASAFSRRGQPWGFKIALPAGLVGVIALDLVFASPGWQAYMIPFLLITAGGIVDGLWTAGLWRPHSRRGRSRRNPSPPRSRTDPSTSGHGGRGGR